MQEYRDSEGYPIEKMNPEVKELWIEYLRSGRFQQGKGMLVSADSEVGERYCCLGVLCQAAVDKGVEGIRKDDYFEALNPETGQWRSPEDEDLPEVVMKWAGLTRTNPRFPNTTAIGMNDSEGATFSDIADAVEEYL